MFKKEEEKRKLERKRIAQEKQKIEQARKKIEEEKKQRAEEQKRMEEIKKRAEEEKRRIEQELKQKELERKRIEEERRKRIEEEKKKIEQELKKARLGSSLEQAPQIDIKEEKKKIVQELEDLAREKEPFVVRKNKLLEKIKPIEKKISALSKKEEAFIVSPAYDVFEIIDENILYPEYLMMWFSRKEFDRNSWFYTDADVRGGLHWDAFCNMQLPVPSIEKQKAIVKEYNTIVNRIKLNEQLNKKLEETAQAIYKQWFVDFEFPNKDGKPYKSSGGRMVWNEELGKEIPEGWEVVELEKLAKISAGGDRPKAFSANRTNEYNVPILSNTTIDEGLYGYTTEPRVTEKSITISARGAIIGYTVLRIKPFFPIVRLIVVTPRSRYLLNYLYECINKFRYNDEASAQGQLTVPEFSAYQVIEPHCSILKKFQQMNSELTAQTVMKKEQTKKLEVIKELLLSKMAKGITG